MRCRSCNAENPDATKFCGNCGQPLKHRCDKCGTENPPQFKFCGECGTALIDSAASGAVADTSKRDRASESVREVHDGRAGERRHLTVLFCDLVGSTEIAAQLDPEEWRETVGAYHRAAAEAITHYGGYVAKYLGDGLMAFFGYPEAHDNDAECAARAGLAILDALARLNEQSGRQKLSARVGIDSGAVVVGTGAGKEADVFGDAPNIAARVQAAAEPGTVLITDAVHRLVSGLFVVEDRGAPALKGIERPVRLYRVVQPSGVRGRLAAAAASRGLTPFVGREDELRLLMNRWERVLEGEGQVAVIIGEAGIGKSRLVQRFHEQIAGIPHTWVEASAAPFFQNTPFYPVVEMLRELLAWRTDQSASDQLAHLESRLKLAGLKPADAVPLIAPLVNLPVPANYPPSPLTPEQQRRRLLATLVEWLLGTTRMQPLIVVTEDLHWADPSTVELIQILVEQGATARLLLLYTARPEFRVEWPLRAHHTQLNLNRLNRRDIRTMVREVAAREALSDETIATVVERTGGVPLFIEELTRVVLESGEIRLTGRAIPATLHDSLMARLDRLGLAKEIIQIGAVIGGEFSYELLHAVHPIGEDDLQHALQRLADSELLYVRGIVPDASYQFKHALIRDAAYGALLKSRRKELHRLVAHTLSEQFPELRETQPEILARHWTEAGEIELAVAEWSRAGKAAEGRNAFVEAEKSYGQALTLLSQLPESPERDLRELKLRQSAHMTSFMIKGWEASETVDATQRLTALAEKSSNLAALHSSLFRRAAGAWMAGDFPTAGALADQALTVAERESNPTRLAAGYMIQLFVRYWRGDLTGAEQHFRTGLKLFDDQLFKQDPIGPVAAFAYGALNAWTLGQPDIARQRFARMMAVVDRNNAAHLVTSAFLAARLHIYLREYERAETLAAQAVTLVEQHQLHNFESEARCVLGMARVQLGRVKEGIALLREGMASAIAFGVRFGQGSSTMELAKAQAREGAPLDALQTIEQALEANPDELLYRPEMLRIRGELQAKQGAIEPAEGDFRDAIAVAQNMGAKAWELRATMSLARLLAKQARRSAARSMLAEIYNWFTEGFDTADLKEAKGLLDELSG